MVYLMRNKNTELEKYSGLPLDAGFVAAGKQSSKTITALESVEEQMDLLFTKIKVEEQVHQLKHFLRKKDEMIVLCDELFQECFHQALSKMNLIYEKTQNH